MVDFHTTRVQGQPDDVKSYITENIKGDINPSYDNRTDVSLLANNSGGDTVGGLLGSRLWSWFAVDAVWVDPSARRRGVGTMLMMEAEAWARQMGCDKIVLSTYDDGALSFYIYLGYKIYGELNDFPPGSTLRHMVKTL